MRVLFDANVLISYLLAPDTATAVRVCVEAALVGSFTVLLPEPLITEFMTSVTGKPYLTTRILPSQAALLISLLTDAGEIIAASDAPISPVFRDDKDDYLLTYSRIGDADYLVTGDKDLQALRDQIERPLIRTPAEFVTELGL